MNKEMNNYLAFFSLILEKEMATHSSTLPCKIPWTEEPGRLQSMGLQRGRHNWATSLSFFHFLQYTDPSVLLTPTSEHVALGDSL